MSIKMIFAGRTHKENESINDCQDYFQVNLENNCFAIADGASQSFYPSIWAELLVNHFCQNPNLNKHNWQEWLQPIQQKWLVEVENRVIKAKSQNSPVWVTNQNRLNSREPATSTFIGVQFIGDQVKISIVGDSCLFIVENNQLKKAYPLNTSKEFNDRPSYFASYSKDNSFTPDFVLLDCNKFPENLYFVLATDALSEYIFKCIENQKNIFRDLLSIDDSEEEFQKFVASARNANNIKMKNDDVTLMVLALSDRGIVSSSSVKTDSTEENDDVVQESRIDTEHITQISVTTSVSTSGNDSNSEIKIQRLAKENQKLTEQNQKLKERLLIAGILATSILFVIASFFLIIDNIKSRKLADLDKELEQLKSQISSNSQSSNNTKPQNSSQNINIQNTNTNQGISQSTAFTIKKGTPIYADQNFQNIILTSQSDVKVKILQQQDKWIKFKINLYAHESTINQKCANCANGEIELTENITLKPTSQGILFGKLNDQSIFKIIKFESEWYTFEFVGYIKK